MTNTPGPERFAIVEIPPGKAPDNSILIGPLDMLMDQIPDSLARNAAQTRLEEAQINAAQVTQMQDGIRSHQIQAFCDGITTLIRRMDAFARRRDARIKAEEEAREAEEQQQIADQLSKLPDPDMPQAWASDGELTVHEPTGPKYEEQLKAIGEADERLEATPDNEGDLPNELLEDVPPVTGTDPEFSKSRPSTARNPVAVSLGFEHGDLSARTRLPPPPISADSLYANYNFNPQFFPDPK